jgi:hypothetical protein
MRTRYARKLICAFTRRISGHSVAALAAFGGLDADIPQEGDADLFKSASLGFEPTVRGLEIKQLRCRTHK